LRAPETVPITAWRIKLSNLVSQALEDVVEFFGRVSLAFKSFRVDLEPDRGTVLPNGSLCPSQGFWFASLDVDLYETDLTLNRTVIVDRDPPVSGLRPLDGGINQSGTGHNIRLMKKPDIALSLSNGIGQTQCHRAVALEAFELNRVWLKCDDYTARTHGIEIEKSVIA
jgi:hypothetical protein